MLTLVVLTLVMSVSGVTNVWADGDDPVPFIILPPGGDDSGGDVPPLPGGLGDNGGGGSGGGPSGWGLRPIVELPSDIEVKEISPGVYDIK